jgi:hypothetical protein
VLRTEASNEPPDITDPNKALKHRELLRCSLVANGPLRQVAFFAPAVANGALRTWLDLQACPAQSLMTLFGVRQEAGKE